MSNQENEVYEVETLPVTREEESQLTDSKRMIAIAKERSRHFEALQTLALQSTQPTDWVDYGGNPGVSGPGSERIMRVFGLRCFNKQRKKITNEDGSYTWQVEGQIGLNEHESMDTIGTCSSKKPFFSKKDNKDIPVADIDESNIIKNADTNFYVNGVSRFLGLRGLTWERLQELTGDKINKSSAQKVDYGSQKPERSEEDETQLKIVWKWLLEMNGNVVQNAKQQLQKLTAFNDFTGYKDINKVSAKVAPRLYKKVEKLYDSWGSDKKKTDKSEKKEDNKESTLPGHREPGQEG
jgi:hypothetical protein